jgi:hypothetical protein
MKVRLRFAYGKRQLGASLQLTIVKTQPYFHFRNVGRRFAALIDCRQDLLCSSFREMCCWNRVYARVTVTLAVTIRVISIAARIGVVARKGVTSHYKLVHNRSKCSESCSPYGKIPKNFFSDFFGITLEMFSILEYIGQIEILAEKNYLGCFR